MPPRIYIYDRSGNRVNDPERGEDRAAGLSWSSLSPKGHASASFRVDRDTLAQWRVKDAYELIIKDGSNILWQGELGGIKAQIQSGREQNYLTANGWYNALAKRYMRRRWVDNVAVDRLVFPDYESANDDQLEMLYVKKEGFITFRGGYGDVSRISDTGIALKYSMPNGTTINDITFSWVATTGEGFRLYVYNVDQAAVEDLGGVHGDYILAENGTADPSTVNHTLAEGSTESLQFRCYYDNTDLYDENDYLQFLNLIIRAEMDSFASPNWYADEIIQDVLEIGASGVISSNYNGLDSPSLAIIPFMTLDDRPETLDSICSRLAQFGDSSGNTYNFYVWDETGASDGLARAYLTQRSTSDYEYRVSLSEVGGFQNEPDLKEVGNYIWVTYRDAENLIRYLNGDTNATLKDTDSIADYGQRDLAVDAGQCDSGTALDCGERWLANRKDPPYRGQVIISGHIRTKQGIQVPVTHIRAGQRIYIEELSETWFLREVRIDGDREQATCIRDLPPNSLETELSRQKAGLMT